MGVGGGGVERWCGVGGCSNGYRKFPPRSRWSGRHQALAPQESHSLSRAMAPGFEPESTQLNLNVTRNQLNLNVTRNQLTGRPRADSAG